MTTNTTKSKSRWGYYVAALYGGFVIFILACVGFASFQHFDLVDKQYYEEGIAHQTKIDQMNRVAALPERPTMKFQTAVKGLVVAFPASFSASELTGDIKLFRPSNAAFDRQVPLALSAEGTQQIDMSNLPGGNWRAQMDWTYHGQTYYQEVPIIAE